MANTKIFKREIFSALADLAISNGFSISIDKKGTLSAEEIADFLRHEIELTQRKNTNGGKLTEKQVENERLKGIILEVLKENGTCTIEDIQRASAELKEYTNQKMSALMKQLVDAGKVSKELIKRKQHFTIVKGE